MVSLNSTPAAAAAAAAKSRNPSTSCGVVAGSSLHFSATCHFFRMTRCRSLRKSRGGFDVESVRRLGDVGCCVDSRVASARGGGGGATVSLVSDAAHERRGDCGCCRNTTSSSKQTLRLNSTGESANVTDFGGIAGLAMDIGAEIPFTPFTPL